MLNKIINFSIKNKLIIALMTIGLIGWGIYETTQLPIDAVPDITNNQVQVITIAPSYGATDIERLVTFPIEQANSNINGLKEIRSFSRFGLSLVTIVFEDNIDIYWARQQVAERLSKIQTEIPKSIGTPELGPISSGLGEIYQYVVRPKKGYEKKYSETDLRTIQDWVVRRQLLGVKGVAEVSSFGGKLKQYEISIQPNQLQAFQLNIQDVFNAVAKNNQNTGGSYIEKGPNVLFIRSEGLIKTKEDIESILIKNSGGVPILLKDVAQVNIGYATRYGAMCYNDQGEVAGAVVMMLKGANSSDVIKNVKERIEHIQTTLPEGVVIEPFLDRTKMVNNAISTVEKNLLEGALIVIFILVLFLGNLRAGILVASVIPLAMLFAVIMMNMFKVSGNLMSLGALDFGLIVDGAVIIVEAVMHQFSHNRSFKNTHKLSQSQMDQEVAISAGKMMNSAVFGQIIILIVYLPILTLRGIEGKMFTPMAQTVAFALIGAFILSLTYIPMMSTIVLSKNIQQTTNLSDRILLKVEKFYLRYLLKALKIKKQLILIVVGMFLISVIIMLNLGGEFIPALEEGDFAVDTRVLTGSNLSTTIEFTQKAAGLIKNKFPEVEKVVTKIGSGEVPTDPMPMEASDMMVILKDKSEWTSASTFPELAEKMGEALKEIPGITAGFQFPVQMRFNELMTGARQDVVCKIFGEDLDTLSEYAEKLGHITHKIDGAQDLYIEPIAGMPQIVIQYNRALIAQYQLNISDINDIVNTAFAGQSAGMVFEGEKRFDLVVRLDSSLRNNLKDIQNLLISLPNGNQLPLSLLADVSIKDGPNQIQREDAKRRIVVGFNVRNVDVQTVVLSLQDKVSKELKLPTGYYITYGGAFENLNEAKARLSIAVPVSLVLIFILLFFAFGSVKQGLLIYTAIPLSAIGGIYFLALRGMPFSISAGVGFIALFGVAVLNGIVLIAEFNRLKLSGIRNLHKIVLLGTKTRLRPVLMTAFVASLGFLPMAISNGAGAEVQRPLATVVIGGLLLATFLTLFILPILYILFEIMPPLKSKLKKVNIVLIIFLILSNSFNAQTITLEQSIERAISENIEHKNKLLETEYQKLLTKSSFDLPKTQLQGEFGQVNSVYFDNKLSISQSFNFPTIYSQKKKMLDLEFLAAQQGASLSKLELTRSVSKIFYQLNVLNEKIKLLKRTDSLYTMFVEKANLKFKAGESNILEKSSANSQKSHILLQLQLVQNEFEILKSHFNLLLNSTQNLTPEFNAFKIKNVLLLDTALLLYHPAIQWYEKQVAIKKMTTNIERSSLLPDITLGYFNQTFKGNGSDDKYYNSSSRFNSAQIGLDIPLFYGAQKARINASKTKVLKAENELNQMTSQLKLQSKNLWFLHDQYVEMLDYFEKNQLNNASVIKVSSNKQFQMGEINYLEWVMLIQQAMQQELDYLDLVQRYNDNYIEINYLNSKNN